MHTFNFFRFLITLVALTLALPVAWAEDEKEKEKKDRPTFKGKEVVVTATRVNESLDDPPVFVEVIEMDQFKGRFVTAQEAVSQAAGVMVKDFGGLGRLSTVSIRGSSSDQVVVLIDGVRINPATGGGADLSSIPANHIERIEIIRGGDSAFYGEGAVGGVINIVTKKSGRKSRTVLGASYGSFNTLDSKVLQSQNFDKGGYLASVSYFHTDGNYRYFSDNGTELDDSDDGYTIRKNNAADNRNLLVKGNWAPSEVFDLALQTDLHSSIKGIPGTITFPSDKAWQSEFRNLTQASAGISGLPAGGVSFKTKASHRLNKLTFSDRFGQQTGVPIFNEYTEYEPGVSQTVQYIWGTHQIITLQGGWHRTILREGREVYGNPKRDTWWAALRDQVILWDGRITLVPAARYDGLSTGQGQVSPKFGLAFKPVAWFVVKGNAGQSFRSPNFSELYFNQGFVQGNPDLKPERSNNYDAGFQVLTRPVFIEAAWFRNDVDDLIEYLLISGFRYMPFNIGKAQIQGAEGSCRIQPWQYISLAGSFTATWALDKTGIPNRDGNQIPGRPRYKAFGRLEGGPSLVRAFTEYHYIGKNFINQANTKLIDPRNIFNAGIVANPSDMFNFGLEVKNVFDEQAADVRGFPLPGRSVFASFEISF